MSVIRTPFPAVPRKNDASVLSAEFLSESSEIKIKKKCFSKNNKIGVGQREKKPI